MNGIMVVYGLGLLKRIKREKIPCHTSQIFLLLIEQSLYYTVFHTIYSRFAHGQRNIMNEIIVILQKYHTTLLQGHVHPQPFVQCNMQPILFFLAVKIIIPHPSCSRLNKPHNQQTSTHTNPQTISYSRRIDLFLLFFIEALFVLSNN